MTLPHPADQLLFSYGTLQLPSVQLDTFGRIVEMREAALLGYRLETLAITDPRVVELSGSAEHPFAKPTGDPRDTVAGVVLAITIAELLSADEYEVDDYTRVAATLTTGETAWLYVDAASRD